MDMVDVLEKNRQLTKEETNIMWHHIGRNHATVQSIASLLNRNERVIEQKLIECLHDRGINTKVYLTEELKYGLSIRIGIVLCTLVLSLFIFILFNSIILKIITAIIVIITLKTWTENIFNFFDRIATYRKQALCGIARHIEQEKEEQEIKEAKKYKKILKKKELDVMSIKNTEEECCDDEEEEDFDDEEEEEFPRFEECIGCGKTRIVGLESDVMCKDCIRKSRGE